MRRDMLRRARVLVVCGGAVDEDVKNDIAVAQRLNITATTLDGIVTVNQQGRNVRRTRSPAHAVRGGHRSRISSWSKRPGR